MTVRINSPGRDGSVALSSDGRTAIFHRGHDDWFDLWTTRRVPKGGPNVSSAEELPASPPEYASFATGQWTPVLRTSKDLAECAMINGDSRIDTEDPAAIEGVGITDGVLQLERRTILLDKIRAGNMVIRARVSMVSCESVTVGVYWPEQRAVHFVLRPGRDSGSVTEFSAMQSPKWNGTAGWFDRFEPIENRKGRWKTSECEIALARVDGYLRGYVDGRLIVEVPVPAELGQCSPKLQAYNGTARFRDIEVQLLDDHIAGKMKRP